MQFLDTCHPWYMTKFVTVWSTGNEGQREGEEREKKFCQWHKPERLIIRVAAVSAPKNTLFLEYFMAKIVVITNVLSPNSDTRMQKSAATKPLVWSAGHTLDEFAWWTGDGVDSDSIRVDMTRAALRRHANDWLTSFHCKTLTNSRRGRERVTSGWQLGLCDVPSHEEDELSCDKWKWLTGVGLTLPQMKQIHSLSEQ